ncbi:MAG: tetratricopeptide repeat protein [Pseudomonadota bacterium]
MISLYRSLLATTLSALLILQLGCTTTPVRDDTAHTATTPTPQPEPPAVELTPKLLYQLLAAEFAGQQGALRLSAATYLDAAQRTRDYRLARRATRVAIYARENTIALDAARLWVELEPGNDEAHKSTAALLIASGENVQARPHLEKLLQNQRQDSNHGYLLVATLLASDPDKERALTTMSELVAREPNAPHALYAQAHLSNQLDDKEAARSILQQLLHNEPNHSQGLLLQARVLHALGDVSASLDSMKRAVELSPDNHQLRLTYARMLVDARELKQARHQFIRLSKATPNDADVVYALGLLALEAGDLDSAEANFNKLLHHRQREEESRFALAQIAEARQQDDKAIEWFSSIAQGDRYLEAQLQAARLIAKHRGMEQARTYLRELEIQNDDERVQLYLAEAELLGNAEQYQEAMKIYDEGLKLFADNITLLYARGLTAEKIDRLDIMERDLKRILQRDPDNTQALNALGYTLADRTDRYQEAYDYIERAYKQRPDDVAILDSMGWVLYRLGRLDEALEYLNRAASKVRDAEISAHLGEVLWASGEQDKARHVWEEALKFAPDHKVLQQTIQRFNP